MLDITKLEALPYGDHWAFSYSTERGEREDYDFRVEFHEGVSEAEERAVIALLEAAPRMLAALKALKTANGGNSFTGWHDSFKEAIEMANEAIMMAEGSAA